MTTLESIVLSYLANAIWQVPLLFVVGWITARVLRPLGPGAEHQAWVGVLLLQALLPAVSTVSWGSPRSLLNFFSGPLNNSQPHVSVVMGSGIALGHPYLSPWLLSGLAIGYVATT